MENLSLHIEYLLLRHDCVVVPGLGAFINVRHAARFDERSGSWHPMTREVRFNSALNHDDGLLSNSFARKSGVSFREGREIAQREIRELTDTLDADHEVTIGALGILQKEDETIRFSPAQTAEQRAASTGYLAVPPVGKPETMATLQVEMETPDPVSSETRTAHSGEPDTDESELRRERRFNTDRNYYIAVNKIFARTAASVIVIFMLALAVIMPLGDRTHEDQASVIPVEKIIRDTASRIAATKADSTLQTHEVLTEGGQGKDDEEKRYHAIVATFSTVAEAENFAAQHEDCGYELTIVSTRTKSRVSAASSNELAEVRMRMGEPAFRSHFSEAWVWENPLK